MAGLRAWATLLLVTALMAWGFANRSVLDLHVLRETLEGTHVDEKEAFWESFAKNYDNPEILQLLEEVESRGRYKEKY